MSKILIVPDVHGRDFWIEPCNKWDGKIIFLGDYHDPYSFQVSKDKSLQNLKLLEDFYDSREDKPIMLFGNHDCSYMGGEVACRFDEYHSQKVAKVFRKFNLKLIHIEGKYIFTHSGVLKGWLDKYKYTLDDLSRLTPIVRCLYDVSPCRGGYDKCGSPIWGDVREFMDGEDDKLEGYYQIFGHTQLEFDPIITESFACLDVRRCFVLDTETGKIEDYA